MGGLLGLGFVLSGCGGSSVAQGNLSEGGVDPESITVADTLVIRIDGVPAGDKQVLQQQVAQDGSINMPHLARVLVTDKTTQELASYLERQYVERKIFTTPIITVNHGGRWVYVYGEVRGPGQAAYVPNMTMIGLISANGGFTEYANKRNIQVRRDGKVFYFNAAKALDNPKYDRPVKPGDYIKVDRTIF